MNSLNGLKIIELKRFYEIEALNDFRPNNSKFLSTFATNSSLGTIFLNFLNTAMVYYNY